MGEIKRLLSFPSRWLGLALFPFAGRLFALCDGVLYGFVVEAVGFKDQLLRIQEFRLEPCPRHLFSSHTMVFEKAASGEGRGSQDADPAYFLAASQRTQAKIQPDCHTYGQQRTDKLPGGKPEKDGLLIIPDFLWYFNFYIASLLSRLYSPNNSLTIRSLIRTAPTKTKRLKMSSPT